MEIAFLVVIALFLLLSGTFPTLRSRSPSRAGGLPFRRRVRAAPCFLDVALIAFGPLDVITRRDACRSIAVFGSTGSGKTSGPLQTYADACAADTGIVTMILASKPEDKEFFSAIYARVGRTLRIMEPDGDIRWNLIDALGGDALNTTNALTTVSKARSGGKASDAFFEQSKERFLYAAITLLKLAKVPVTTRNIAELMMTAPKSPAVTRSPDIISDEAERHEAIRWRNGMFYQTFEKANKRDDANELNAVEKIDFQTLIAALLAEWPEMNDRTRSSILADIMGVLGILNSGFVAALIGVESNFSFENFEKGESILINLSPTVYGESGKVVITLAKFVVQRLILRRKVNPDSKIISIICDEYHNVCNMMDAQFVNECRSHHANMFVLTQSLPNLYTSMDGPLAEHYAKALMGAFGTTIFNSLTCPTTAAWASERLGKRKKVFVSGTQSQELTLGDELTGKCGYTPNFSHQIVSILEPTEFMAGMRTHGGTVDAIAIKAGEPWSTGEQFLRVSFKQG